MVNTVGYGIPYSENWEREQSILRKQMVLNLILQNYFVYEKFADSEEQQTVLWFFYERWIFFY